MVVFRKKWVFGIVFVLACVMAGLWLVAGAASQEKQDRIVYVYSDSCGYCASFKPTFEKVSADFLDQNTGWVVEKLDIFKEADLAKAQELGAMVTPTVFIIKDGEVVDKLEGDVPEKSLQRFLSKNVEGKTQ